jgi:putative peptidoglycan lipid II flippase
VTTGPVAGHRPGGLFRSAVTVGGMTMISRLLGFVRDLLIAAALGTGPVADAFVIAFRFPNLFRRLFAEGAFNAAFVPLFAKRLEGDGTASARRFAEEAMAVLTAAVVFLLIVAEIAMPVLIYAIAPGFADTPDKLSLAAKLTAIAFPYLPFMSLVALYSGVLNSLGRFAAAAAAPIVLNVVLIAVLIAIAPLGWDGDPATGVALAWGVSAAGLLQLALVVIATARGGLTLRLRRPRLTPDVRRLIVLGIPGVIAGGITQINLLIGTIFASNQDSAVSFLYYADRIYQLPLGVVGIAIGVVLLPDLSRKLRAGDGTGVDSSQNLALEFSMLLTVPAAAALVAMPWPIIQVLFERGAFSADDTLQTARALAAYGLGLPAFVLIKIFSPGFFAREDTRTPMIYAGIAMAANVVAILALFPLLGHVGIALATTVSAWLNAGLLAATLARRGQLAIAGRTRRRVMLIVLSSTLMAAGLWAGLPFAEGWFTVDVSLAVRAAALAGIVLAGAAAFVAFAHVTGAARIGEVTRLFRRR